MNSVISVAPRTRERKALECLQALLQSVPGLKDATIYPGPPVGATWADFKVEMPTAGGEPARFLVEVEGKLTPSDFHKIAGRTMPAANSKQVLVRVLALPRVSPRIRELCRQHGWSWFDFSGNCVLNVPPGIYVERLDRKPAQRPPRPAANLGTPESGRVLRALLAPENAGMRWTQRQLAEHFDRPPKPIPNPSLALVNKVVQHLREEAFLEPLKGGGFRVRDPLELLNAWNTAYRFDRHERQDHFSLKQGRALREALLLLKKSTAGGAMLASFSAAEHQAPHVRHPLTWIYVRPDWLEKVGSVLTTRRVDSGENLVVLVADDPGVFYKPDEDLAHEGRLACTNPVQTYVDLMHSGGRGEEAAAALLEQAWKPAWRAKGYKV